MDKFIIIKRKPEDGVPLNRITEKEYDPIDPVASTSVLSKVVQENKQPTPILVRQNKLMFLKLLIHQMVKSNRCERQLVVKLNVQF